MLQASDYFLLDEGLYEIPFATVLGRRPGTNTSFQDLGDWDSFSINLNPTRKDRWTKRGAVSQLATTKTTRIESQVTGKAMQKTGLIRAASLMGVLYDDAQTPGPVAPVPVMIRAGEYLYLGSYNISSPVVKYDNGTKDAQGNPTFTALNAAFVRLADPALGIVQVTGLPGDAKLDDDGFCVGTYGATVKAEDVTDDRRVDIATAPDLGLELIVRGESNVGRKGYFHLFEGILAPDGEQNAIASNEDFEGVTLKGRARVAVDPKTKKSIVGYWRSLAA